MSELERGAALYHAGELWEAHEVWEHLWRELPREDPRARALRGLIQVAAAGLKAREGRAAGVASLTAKAAGELRAAGQDVELGGKRLETARLADELEAWCAAGHRTPPPRLPLAGG